ncbi:MAG: AAA family ATPase [Gracilibacteraceae bacterium]|jgi:chromosomal replication initiation ATPase DnaA|nr:AAA family ATPase [Gracilibacteraceae bacterium]
MYVSDCNGLCFHVLSNYDPVTAPDVLLLRGCAGSGKTELLKHLWAELRKKSCRVSFLDSAAFARKFAFLLQKGDYSAWRRELRASDILLIDDIHSLSGKKKSLEEMHYTMKDVISRGGKAVITACEAHYCPEALGKLFSSSLNTALSFAISNPTMEEKEQFLRYYSQSRGLNADDLSLPLADMSFKDITLAVEGHALGEPFTLRDIKRAYQEVMDDLQPVRHEDIVGRSKKSDIVKARREICFRLTKDFGFSNRDVARFLGHTQNCIRQRCRAYAAQGLQEGE